MAKQKKPRPKRMKQKQFPGMETPKVKAIESLADAYAELRDERMQLQEQEEGKRTLLMAKMHEHGLMVYEYEGKKVELSMEEKLYVRKAKKSLVEQGREHLNGKPNDEEPE